MTNKVCNAPFDQIPHVVINHPDTKPEHWAIMIALFKILKNVNHPIIYSNDALSKRCRISLRNVERRIPELVKMGFLSITGRGYNRKISLGILFTNPAILAVGDEQIFPNTANMAVEAGSSLNNSAKSAVPTAKSDLFNRQYGGDYKRSIKKSFKRDFSSLTHSEKKEIQYCLENGFALAEEFKYLQPFLDECLQ